MRQKLTPRLLEYAYRNGFFPMADDDGEVGWYRPDPRAILPLDGFHVSRSLQRTLNRADFVVKSEGHFEEVMRACGDRPEGTWMNEEFIAAYTGLHRLGKAHAVSVWQDGKLVGGTYGVCLGGAFFAESKFHRVTDASKVALHGLVERLRAGGFSLLEVQFLTPHLQSLGAVEIAAEEYERRLEAALELPARWL
jgi:leucyl/phenylalanyl-tRNA--protein transferase